MKKTVKRILALIAVVAIVLSVGLVSVSAAETVQGTTTSFNKYLIMKEKANVPQVTFQYAISKTESKTGRTDDVLVEETRNAEGAILTPRVYSTIVLTGAPTITSEITFRPGDTTYATVQDGDTLTLEAGYKYAKIPLTLDFSGITFTKPGIYRFKINEVNTTNDGVTNDTNLVRYCDVYVNQNSGVAAQDLQVQGYCIHESADKIPENGYTNWNDYAVAIAAGELKDNGFENTYTTYDLTIQKNITGNHGWKNNYFQFTLTIKGVLPNSRYDLDLSNTTADDNKTATGVQSRGEDENKVYYLQADADGNVSYTFYLSNKGGKQESIKVYGLTAATTYNISEDYQDYDPSWNINYNDAGVITKRVSATNSGALTSAYEMNDHDNEVLFVNDRSVTVATGIMLDVIPFVLVAALGTAAAFVLVAHKKKKKVTE